MSEKPTITPAQAALAVEAAGLDLDRPLSEQVGPDLEAQLGELNARVDRLTEAQGDHAESTAEPVDPEHAFARTLASRLAESQSKWLSSDG